MCIIILTFWMGVARLQMTDTHCLATSRNRAFNVGSSTNGRVPPSITRALGRFSLSSLPPPPLPPPLLPRPTFHRKASGLDDSLESTLLSVLESETESNSLLRDSRISLVSSCNIPGSDSTQNVGSLIGLQYPHRYIHVPHIVNIFVVQ